MAEPTTKTVSRPIASRTPAPRVAVTNRTLSPSEIRAIDRVMPLVRKESPAAALVITRLVRVASRVESTPGQPAEPEAGDALTALVSVAEAARVFQVTPQTVRNWTDKGWLPCERTPGGTRRIPRSALESAMTLSRSRPPVPDLTPEAITAIIGSPRRR